MVGLVLHTTNVKKVKHFDEVAPTVKKFQNRPKKKVLVNSKRATKNLKFCRGKRQTCLTYI